MTNKKPVYLLAGGRGTGDRTVVNIIGEIVKETGTVSPNIAYIGAASQDNKAFFLLISAMFKKAGAGKVNHAVISHGKANLNKARDIIESSDAVFMSGGDVEAGMQILKEKNMIDYLQNLYATGKLFFGASAGSIMLAKEWVRWENPDDDSTAQIFPCLGLVPVICDTHAEDDNWQELKILLSMEKENSVGYGIAAKSCLKVIPDGEVEALGSPVHKFVKRLAKVEQEADILPG
jgi:cyanophycinase-like exopeptidase